ncbi:hypothetical protein [Nocardia arthritidis]|uniref:Uncharacterized protein n=1 Tax=Nocardia arthritidis TaxID=228602 RepID=A0A6G9Y813_9NOCA|nr:hypothetical protein [Nocardia arthritidis]QIS09341.1 hypothetical protein F5544_07165 [Nocardia arthritidis]
MTSSTTRRPALVAAIRAVAALTVVGSAVAVTALTVRHGDQVATVVVTQERAADVPANTAPAQQVPGTPPSQPKPVPAAPAPAAPAAAPHGAPAAVAIAPGSGVPSSAVPLGTSPGAPSNAVPLGTSPGAPNNAVPLNTSPGASGPFAAAPANTQPPCPLGWPAPKQQGGLASLIGLAPLAGPFSSEAFALGSVYQPILQLAGPVLAEIAPVIARYQPVLDPIIANVQGVEAIVLQAILPYYGPYRDQLIAAEGDLAKVLAPVLNRAYNSEIASCFVAWQGQVIEQAKGGRITVASLAHPGTVVELGPEE